MTDFEKARSLLSDGGYTVVLCRGETVRTDTRRGVAPLLTLLDEGADVTGFAAADRVVGKAAAFLYLRLGVSAVYAPVMSVPALDVLRQNGVEVEAEQVVPSIRRRLTELTGAR